MVVRQKCYAQGRNLNVTVIRKVALWQVLGEGCISGIAMACCVALVLA